MRIRELRGLGPASERMLAAVGITTAEQLRELGPAAAYVRLRDAGVPDVTRVMLWALAGAIVDEDWRRLPDDVKDELRRAAGED